MAAAAVASPVSAIRDEYIMDTRTPSPSPSPVQRPAAETGGVQESATEEKYQPDLSQEVAMLSAKLINAINYQTNLDDSLQNTRHELERVQQELSRVKAEKQSLDDAITQGVLVKKSEVDVTIAQLRAEIAKEKERREAAERAKRQTDGELQDLTANLFEEANKMVAEARKDTEAAEKRNSQLRGQIQDTEVLLASQQEQLQDLKLTMEKLERIDTNITRDSSMPSTPINSTTGVFDGVYASPGMSAPPDVPPNQPLHFSQLLHPVLRTDVATYADFSELLNWARFQRNNNTTAPHSRTASGNAASASQTNLSSTALAAASMSSTNLPGAFSFGSSSANNSPSSSNFNPFAPPLKESKFYKRALVEDIDPTLRLDLAPGLSFLSRRTVNAALLNGTLGIEPFNPPASSKFYSPVFACSLCGESRKTEPYIRRHRFRTSENDDASRYPLCGYCLERVRASADLVAFLRMVRDGHWRCGNEEEEKSAWEEAVRLRERCFWARVGGGVVPSGFVARRAEEGSPIKGRESLEVPSFGKEATADGRTIRARSQSPLRRSESVDAEPPEGGIGRAIVNMASRAASNAVPALPPRERVDTATTETSASSAAEGNTTLAPAVELDTETNSQTEQMEADAQLQREASAVSVEEDMKTPLEEPEPQLLSEAPADASAPPVNSTAESTEATTVPEQPAATGSSSRPTSSSSVRGRVRSLSPSKAAVASSALQAPKPADPERRPSSSSVLDRVRAMEGRK